MSAETTDRFAGRVLHLIPQLRGSAGRYVVDVAVEEARRARGVVGVVVSADVDGGWSSSSDLLDELAAHAVPVFRCGDFFRRHLAGLKATAARLHGIALADNPDVLIHAHTAMSVVLARWAGARTVVATCHGWNSQRAPEFDLQDAFAWSLATRVTTTSRYWARELADRSSVRAAQIIPLGLNLARYPAPRSTKAQRPVRVVAVGDVSARTAPDLLLNAMARVWSQTEEVELHIVGRGEALEKTRALAMTLDPTGRKVSFHDRLTDEVRLADFDIFVRPVRTEDDPAGLIEAMLAGLPIVGTAVGPIPELVDEARCGIVVPADAPRRLAAAIGVLATTSAEARAELGAFGHDYARAHHGIDRHVTALHALYDGEGAVVDRAAWPAGTRLHLGCGTDRREGWINVDARADVRPDVVAKADALTMFDDGSVETIEACHLFEHLPFHEAQRAIAEWFRVLGAHGTLHLELPNFDACLRLIGRESDRFGHDLGMVGIYGWPEDVKADGPAQVHKWGWTPESLTAALRAAGFTDVSEEPVTQRWRPATRLGRDFRLRAVKPAVMP